VITATQVILLGAKLLQGAMCDLGVEDDERSTIAVNFRYAMDDGDAST
jgi:hypothetical protein